MEVGKRRRPLSRRSGWLAAVAGAVAAVPAPAAAGSFKINPVQVVLPAEAGSTSLTITNVADESVAIRATALAWSQADGADVRTPTTNVIVSPPIFTIAAGKTQLIRVGLRSRAAARAYRLIFEEIPQKRAADGQINVNLRLDLPLFLPPAGGGRAEVSWHAWKDQAGTLVLEGRNRGNLHAQVTGLGVQRNGKTEMLSRQPGVVLPQSARRWTVEQAPPLATLAPLDLVVRSPLGETRARVAVEQR